ncbi:hypothetical protein [Phenylobacterium sp.]|uniref:hypothetical protein n=1 Tax=Phenylobacterium sp. TaxID=1871053 RepID=UPI0011F4C8E2|nr:hypothetical protein [Phenylobacterium sp.]THD61578.1 MAG: hypothetical protein E8A49_11435 [Phenylobacterium sp.]
MRRACAATAIAVAIACIASHAIARGPAKSDLSAVWTNSSLTELERPIGFKNLTLSDTEAAAYERRRPGEIFATEVDDVGGRQSESVGWDTELKLTRIAGQARTSWLIDPADGQLPYSAAGRAALAEGRARAGGVAGPEDRSIAERCLLPGRGASGPPLLANPYANLTQIVQTRDAVVIALENNHDVRIIRLGVTTHLPPTVRPWMGDTIGHWEGRTLVAETTNFNPGEFFRAPTAPLISAQGKVTERFTRLSPTALHYEFEVDDPITYTQVWRGEMMFLATKGPLYEYACHEGNYALGNILAGARRQEAETTASARLAKTH